MSIVRKLAVSVAGLIVGITGVLLTAAPSSSVADCSWGKPVPCSSGPIVHH